MLHEQIKGSLKEAMMNKEAVRLATIRALLTAFTNELVAKGKMPNEFLADDEALAVITRLAKQRKDSIAQFREGGREDLVAEEQEQLTILEAYLPELMSKEEVEKVVKAKQAELGIDDATKKGMLMAAVMKDLKGKADGVLVKEVVDALF